MPIARMTSGIHRPRWCLRKRQKAINVAPMWMNSEENKAHRNTEYQISETQGKTVQSVKNVNAEVIALDKTLSIASLTETSWSLKTEIPTS